MTNNNDFIPKTRQAICAGLAETYSDMKIAALISRKVKLIGDLIIIANNIKESDKITPYKVTVTKEIIEELGTVDNDISRLSLLQSLESKKSK